MRRLTVDVEPGEYVVLSLAATDAVPPELLAAGRPGFVSVTRSGDGLSVVCPAEQAMPATRVATGRRLLTVRGPLEFTLTGITAALSGALAAAGVPAFTLSTFDTDHLLVAEADLPRAVRALREAGHEVADGS